MMEEKSYLKKTPGWGKSSHENASCQLYVDGGLRGGVCISGEELSLQIRALCRHDRDLVLKLRREDPLGRRPGHAIERAPVGARYCGDPRRSSVFSKDERVDRVRGVVVGNVRHRELVGRLVRRVCDPCALCLCMEVLSEAI